MRFNYSGVARVGLLCLLLSRAVSGDGDVLGWNKLVYLIYRIEVTNYCGLTSERVIAGFGLQQKSMLEQYAFQKPLITEAQSEAWKLAHQEWDNRGLGGFKRWCQTDATRYANEFIRVFNATNDL